MNALEEAPALAGLEDADARVRECVIAAAAPLAGQSRAVSAALLRLADDVDARVRFQVALALGGVNEEGAAEALARLVGRDGKDAWMRAAILSSAVPHSGGLLLGLLGEKAGERAGAVLAPDLLGPLLGLAAAQPDQRPLEAVKKSIAIPGGKDGHYAPWQFTALAGLLEARDNAKQRAADFDKPFGWVWPAARRAVESENTDDAERVAAAGLIGYSAKQDPKDRELLLGLLRPQVSAGLQVAAVAALARTTDPKLADLLVHDWRRHSPQVRNAILDALLSRTAWVSSLLSSLEDGCVPPAEIDPARRQQLLKGRSSPLRARAEAVFAHQARPRQAVVDSFRPALAHKGDPIAGAAVFKKLCASCHRLGKEGVDVGPDLAALSDKSPEALLIAVLDPNRAFETKYTAFSIATVDGRVLNGLVASESATAVTLRRQDGKEDVLLRSQIEEMAASGQSLMPEGVEKDLKPGDLADLIAFLASTGAVKTPE
jgi:putative heme-binding domain-containing protein